MKKLAALFLAGILCLTFAACGGGTTKINKADGLSAEECYLGVIESNSAKEMSEYTYGDAAEDYYDNVEHLFGGDDFSVKAEYSGKYKEYDVFYLTVTSKSNKSKQMSNFELFKKVDNDYLLVLGRDLINEVNRECVCPTCGGTGGASTHGNACAICAGTGVQYYPNSYFDAGTGMWMGETRACSGCGGAGYLGGTTSGNCGTCHGRKYVFDK